jgi:hypothetical protein
MGGCRAAGCVADHTFAKSGMTFVLSGTLRIRQNWIKIEKFAILSMGLFARRDADPIRGGYPAVVAGSGFGRSGRCTAGSW